MVKKERKFNLKSEYKLGWKYLVESKKFIYLTVGIFLFFFFLGFFVTPSEEITQSIFKFIQELLEKTDRMSHFELIKFIFFNNVQSGFFGLILGTGFGLFPLFATITNGFLIGFVSSFAVSQGGFFVLWRLLPHGIFELPAIFISFGLGLKLGSFILYKEKMKTLKTFFISSLKVFFYFVIPLLIIAGIIEGTLIALI